MFLYALSKGLSDPVQALLKNSWRTMKRSPELDYKLYAENTMGAAVIAESEGYAGTLTEYARFIHENNRRDLWLKDNRTPDHDQPFETLDGGMKLNYIIMLHAYKAGLSVKSTQTTDSLKNITLQNWHRKSVSERLADERFSKGSNTIERSVLVNQKIAWESRGDLTELMWNDTAIAAIQAVHETISNLNEAQDENKFRSICQRLHELMINNRLWGSDSENPDRVTTDMTDGLIYSFEEPKPFNELPMHLKENYVLIALATLSGIADYMKKATA